jgi:hypothetical protein
MRRSYKRRFGGNSGYVGYSMSVRALNAKNDGRYPKTQFKKEYSISEKTLNVLVDLDIISDKEWHHTSKYGNRTTFYSWVEESSFECFIQNKSIISSFIRKNQLDKIIELFETFV